MRMSRESAKRNAWEPSIASMEVLEPRLLLAGSTYWAIDPVDQPGNVGQFASMVSDSEGHSYISYYDATNGDLKYATNVTGSWVTTLLDTVGNVGTYTSIALDADNNPRISYVTASGNLKYIAYDGAAWSAPLVVHSGTDRFTSIAIAPDGTPHIAYFSMSDHSLGHSWYDSGTLTWTDETVDDGGSSVVTTEINDTWNQLDGWYYVSGINALNSDSGREYVNIVSDGGGFFHVDMYSDLARTALVAHSASYNSVGQISVHQDNASGIGGTLNVMAVTATDLDISVLWTQTAGWVGAYPSLKISPSGTLAISYYDVTGGRLKYTTKAPLSTWTAGASVDANNQPNVGEYTSLALDTLDRPHIAYYEVGLTDGTPTGNLRYATWSSGSWHTYTIDSEGDVGLFASIVLDAADRPTISYLDYTNGNLKLARFDGVQWNTQVVDNLGWDSQTNPGVGQNTGFYSSVQFVDGQPAVAYYNYNGANLNFATLNYKPVLTQAGMETLQGAQQNTPFSIVYDGPTGFLVKSHATDAEADPLSFRIESVTSGTLTLNGTSVVPGTTLFSAGDTLEWTPAADANGLIAAFTVVAWEQPPGHVLDPTENTATSGTPVQVTVNVRPANNSPTLTTVSTLSGMENTSLVISYATLLAASDAADVDGDTLSFRVEAVSSGTLTKDGVAVVPGVTLLNGSGSPLVWTPDTNAIGVLNAFTIVAYDGTFASAPPVQVKVDVAANNTAPTLTTITTLTGLTENTPVTITYAQLAAAADEADADGDVISFRIEAVSSGTLTKGGVAVIPGETLINVGDSVVWTPASGASGVLNAFTVRAWDGRLASATAVQVKVQVTPNAAADLVGAVDLTKVGRKVKVGTYRKSATGPAFHYKMPEIPFILTNQGTAAAPAGYVTMDLYASTDATLDTATATKIQSISLKIKKALAVGASQKFKFPSIVAPDLGAGNYYIHMVINPGGLFKELNTGNNTASSDRTLEWLESVTAPPLPTTT